MFAGVPTALPPDGPGGRVATVARRLPKVELHCHLEGSARPTTIVELARRNGVRLPVDDPVELFRFTSLTDFLEIYGIVCAVIQTPDDLRRITYEALEDAVEAGVRYREMFFSPAFLMARMTLPQVWMGIRAGLADAHADLDVRCRMILALDKAGDPSSGPEWVAFAADQDRDELIGIGGDGGTERGLDHRVFAEAYALAARNGLRRTMHAGEDGPAANLAVCLDELGCERIDHGVRVVEDPALLARVADERVPLTVCPISNVLIANLVPDIPSHPYARLRAAGVLATLNADDPGMTATTVADDYEQVADAFGYDLATMASIALDGIEASWAPDDEKRALRARFDDEIAALVAGASEA
jgi:adenosine deaminase